MRVALLALALCASVFLFGCPSQSQLDRAARASDSIAHYTGEAITITGMLYRTGAIKLDVKDKVADQLIVLSRTGKKFNDLISHYNQLYKSGTVPANVWSDLISSFDEVTKPFLSLLDLIPRAAGLKDSKAFRIISAGVVAIAQIMMANGVAKYRGIDQKVRDRGIQLA